MQGILKDVELLQSITEACRESVRAFVERRTNTAGRVTTETLSEGFMRFAGLGAQPWTEPLKVTPTALALLCMIHLLPYAVVMCWQQLLCRPLID